MNMSRYLISRLLLGLLLAAGVSLTSIPAFATGPFDSFPTHVQNASTIVEHLRAEIRSKDLRRSERALVDIVALSNCSASCQIQFQSLPDRMIRIDNETGAGAAMDLSALVPDLLRTYRSGPSDGHRLLALSALLAIGHEPSLESLTENPTVVSDRVARATRNGLVAFYLARYPELMERALRTGTVFLDDVRIARAREERAQRRLMRKG